MGAGRDHREVLDDLPPSCKLVYKALAWSDEDLCKDEIANRTHLGDSTTGYALRRLREEDLVDMQRDLVDARRHRYKIRCNNGD
jgi:DNA-binding MarR family transcriptional regulator